MANSNFLPGVNAILNDLGLRIAPPPAGPRVTLLGITSNTGIPLNEALTISSVEKAVNGLYFSGSAVDTLFPGELALAVEEASQAGSQNVEIMVIAHEDGVGLENFLDPAAPHTGRYTALSGAYDILTNRTLDVVVPVGAYIDDKSLGGLAGTANFGKQLADFCFQVTSDQNAAHGIIAVAPPAWWALQNTSGAFTGGNVTLADEVYQLAGGDSSGAIDRLRGVYFGSPSTALVNDWHKFHSADGPTSTGAYSTRYGNYLSGSYDDANKRFANAATSSILSTNYFTSWQALDADGVLAVDDRGNKVDAGAYLSVLAVPIRQSSNQARELAVHYTGSISETSYNTDGMASYAGLVNSLAPHSATTNKFIPGVFPQKLLSRSQANTLVGMRFVTMYQRSKGFVVAKDVTGAHNVNRFLRSDYVLLTTVRIVQTVVDLIRAIGEEFIGEPNTAAQINALSNEIDQALISMKGTALNAFDFVVQSTPEQRVLGEVSIALTLVPAFEVTNINLTVSLAKSL